MKLIVFHQILIAFAIGLAIIFGIRSIVIFSRTSEMANLAMAIVSAIIAVALALYLRKVRAKWVTGRTSVPVP